MGLEIAKGVSLFLGAGASCDYGFPSGYQLMWDISGALNGSKEKETAQYLRKYSNYDEAALLAVGEDLNNALQQSAFDSIDAYLDQRRQYTPQTLEICRQAVWCLILEYERKAELYPEQDWMLEFFKLHFHEAKTAYGAREVCNPISDSPRVGISIYTLNYDRLFEWKLFCYLKGRYGDTEEVRKHLEIMEGEVTHSHGWLGRIASGTRLPFGGEFPETQEAFLEASGKLKFWFEVSANHWTWNISNLYSFRETLLILGYGLYSGINSRFDPNRNSDSKLSRIYSTCFGGPEARRNEVASWICERFVINTNSLSIGSETERCCDIIQKLVQKQTATK
jgi:hypothetical protein